MKKDSNRTDKSRRSETIEDTLRSEAQRIPAPEQPGRVAQIMRKVRAMPRMVGKEAVENEVDATASGWIPWLMAGATATAAVSVAIIIAYTATSRVEHSSPSNLPRQANLPRIVESRVDPVLASREQDLAGELQRIRADLDSIGRMVSIRLESDAE